MQAIPETPALEALVVTAVPEGKVLDIFAVAGLFRLT